MIKREIENLRVLDHPNVIKLHDVFEDSMYLHIVMDYCKGGDLIELIVSNGPLSE
jgi:calcium-dependent protein kinase